MVHYNDIGSDTYYGQNYFNCHAGTTYEVCPYITGRVQDVPNNCLTSV